MIDSTHKKYVLTENNIEYRDISNKYFSLRKELFQADQREGCIIVQGSAFVTKGEAYILIGTGGIDFLDSISQLKNVEGIIGNGNALFISNDFQHVYSAHSREELLKCYELEGHSANANFIYSAPIAPLIFIIRSFQQKDEYCRTRIKYKNILFEAEDTFCGEPSRFAGSLKARLRSKFVSTTRVVHCASRPSIQLKECLFDSCEKIRTAIDNFHGKFCLVYTLWNQTLCDVIGMNNTRNITDTYNPTDPITPHLVKIARDYR